MKLKVFTFRFCEKAEAFEDEEMQQFTADKEIVEFSEHFFIYEKRPYLAVVLSYRDAAPGGGFKSARRQDPRGELDEREKLAYDGLRTWRAAYSACFQGDIMFPFSVPPLQG